MSWVDYVPPWATEVVQARHEVWNPSDGTQRIEAKCLICGADFRYVCATGAARSHIAKFAWVHQGLHSDPMAIPKKEKP